MTLSAKHEDLVDAIRFGAAAWNHENPSGYIVSRCAIVADCICFGAMFPTWKNLRLVADCYLLPDDDFGPIMVEVGHMPSRKWNSITLADGLPVRVLRCTFDGAIGLTNRRHTPFEDDFMPYIAQHVANEVLTFSA